MNQVIPEAAVEAAAKALYPEVREEWRVPPPPWESIPEDDDAKIEAIALARLALEAAAPHMLPVEQGSAMQEATRLAWEQGWANARANYLALHQGQEIPDWVTLRNPYGTP